MSTTAACHQKTIERNVHWLRAAAVSFGALLLLAAAADQRNGIVDRTAGHAERVEQHVPPASTDSLVHEMLTHD